MDAYESKRWVFRLISFGITLLAVGGFLLWLIPHSERNRYFELDEAQVAEVLASNEYESEYQRTVAEAAASLYNKVYYFPGGKSISKGWDDKWGEPRRWKDADGNMSNYTWPYGLDTDGFITWVFLQIDSDEDIIALLGDEMREQWDNSDPVKWKDIRAGDLVFLDEYPDAEENCVAVCIGYYGKKPVFATSNGRYEKVMVITAGRWFRFARRPKLFGLLEQNGAA